MKLRSMVVARMHKFNKIKNPHEFYLSELQLYKPFINEDHLCADSLESCKIIYDDKSDHNGLNKITNVKRILMEHLEDVEEGTEKAQEEINSKIAASLDAANEQDNADCENEELCEHPDFLAKDPSDLDVGQSTTPANSSFKKIALYSNQQIEDLTLGLDKEQRMVLDIGVDYAKNIVKETKQKIISFKAPLLIVQGGAGTGKSFVIDAMTQQIEKILRKPGDNPNHPYILKVAFTGTAAANIGGQKMHSAFSFNFGNEFFSLGDKSRDEKRNSLENLKIVIVDEYSMIKSDMLYQLDLRLKEITQRTKLDFGGLSVFLCGDILQLRPVLARYIMEEPRSESYHLAFLVDSLWEKFDVIMLKQNHRQGEDREYADILNRLRIGNIEPEDMKNLDSRVRPINHPDIPKKALVVSCKNEEVNSINEVRLGDLEGPEYIVHAVAKTHTQKLLKPHTDAAGAIRNTPLQKTLKLKIKARVMLTHNIDTCDSLTNGTFGEVIGLEFDSFGVMNKVIVQFDDEKSGKEKRMNNVALQRKYSGSLATPIERLEFHYSLSKKKTSSVSNAMAIQFPLRLAFSATAHKIQGYTVVKPNNLVIDLRGVKEAAQAYVMLSRVQALSQLIILDSVCAHKIYANEHALKEHARLTDVAINNRVGDRGIISCNIRSLVKHFKDFTSYPQKELANVICLQETWFDPIKTNDFEIEGLQKHFNSIGAGKGIATYFSNSYNFVMDITNEKYQITKIKSKKHDIINVYRSATASSSQLLSDLKIMFDNKQQTLIVGDFNICYLSELNHKVIKTIKELGFQQKVLAPTHMGGRLLDHVYIFTPDSEDNPGVEVEQQSVYFTDHDLLFVRQVTCYLNYIVHLLKFFCFRSA